MAGRREGDDRVIVILAHPDDPVTARFADYARWHGRAVWQPASLADFGCSIVFDGGWPSFILHDRPHNRRWSDAHVAGLWYQAMPPLPDTVELTDRDRSYMAAEFAGMAALLWQGARCPVIGQPPWTLASGLFDAGLESRIHLRRLGLPAVAERVGPFSSFTGASVIPSRRVRIVSADAATSFWLMSPDGHRDDAYLESGEIVAGIEADESAARVAVQIGSDVIVVSLDRAGGASLAGEDGDFRQIVDIVTRVQKRIATPVFVCYFVRQAGLWLLTRLSLQLPYWLADLAAEWMLSRLLVVFSEASLLHPDLIHGHAQ